MSIVTIKDAKRSFARLLKAKRKRKAKSYNDVGGFVLDHNIGGVVIEKISNKRGGISQPFGARRRTPREFVEFVNAILNYSGRM